MKKDREESSALTETYVQNDQPEGVPPLKLTGERTLPDVPDENYWYQRHLAVYQWIATQVAGLTVVDLACGEGYGSAVLAETAADVIGVDANPEAFEHARTKYSSEALSFRRELVESFKDPRDAIVFLQTIEHIEDPDALLAGFTKVAPVSFISTPNLLTLAPEGAEKSDNPWHIREYRLEEYRALLEPHFSRVEIHGLSHAGKLRWHEHALSLGWDRFHETLGLTKPFYDWFTPAIDTDDFQLSNTNLESALDFIAVCHV